MRASSVNHIILETLEHNHAHLTAQQIYESICERLPAVNPSTVYRALERMAHAGNVSISDMGQGAAMYEAVGGQHHHHLVCQNCGQILTLGDEDVNGLFREIEKEHNFQMVTNHLVLFGICAQCRQETA
jgi:Fur family transcriptional regulator, ferric uptake regulator